jgi:glutamine amidotransferase
MRALTETGMDDVIREAAASKPFLGICMGQQVLMKRSEENGGTDLLGLYAGTVDRFPETLNGERYKVPQMGWNTLRQTQPHPLFKGIDDNSYFYFVHSYYLNPEDPSLMAGETEYGVKFAAAIARDNVFAIQCHPEKSAAAGLKLLTNFIHWNI